MLFADDVILTSYCVAGLQKQIDVLKHFAGNYLMAVNIRQKLLYSEKEGSLQPLRFGGVAMRRKRL